MRNENAWRAEYDRWLRRVPKGSEEFTELTRMSSEQVEDAFYKDLKFGTGGLRGILGAGTNRMNAYVVRRASKGLAAFLKEQRRQNEETGSVVIGFDSRLKSKEFADLAARTFAAEGLQVWLWPRLLPVTTVSFAVRELGAMAGVMITASHNPAEYNGYKVYGSDGCQITEKAASRIAEQIGKTDLFEQLPERKNAGRITSKLAKIEVDEERDTDRGADKNFAAIPGEKLREGSIQRIPEAIFETYLHRVKARSVWNETGSRKNISIVYSPLNGTGREPVLRVLRESGFASVTVVPEQEMPDGNFPTCPSPNPENPEAMRKGLALAAKEKADLFLATDPDCDRIGIGVCDRRGIRGEKDAYVLLSGNETGILLLNYICERRLEEGTMPARPVVMKTIVTTDMACRIADLYGAKVRECLTGFKYIGEQIGILESEGRGEDFLFALEESCGYLSGTYVREKDGVYAALQIAEMTAYYAEKGIGLTEKLEEIYRRFGYMVNIQSTYAFPGAGGEQQMRCIMDHIRNLGYEAVKTEKDDMLRLPEIFRVTTDYLLGVDGLPKADVIKWTSESGMSVVFRPSGTEPKLKLYFSAAGREREEALYLTRVLQQKIENGLRLKSWK